MMSIKPSKNFYRRLTTINKNHQTLSIWWSPCFFIPWIIFFVIVLVVYNALPTPILQSDELQYPLRFVGERAQIYNRNISNIGPKVVGSDANQILAVEYLRDQVLDIANKRNPIHNIEVDVQVASGSFQLFTMLTVYQNVQNVVVKLSPANAEANADTEYSLLLSAHFDSVPISPGASDACTMVAVALEILRVMSKNPTTFRHTVIFLFNGAEENGLHGSHAFITQHKWASTVRAFINMDAAGSGGREVMFQTTLGNQWMMKYYNRHAPHPMSTALGEEIFQTNIIPSDTDFRIFRDYGKISGMDFAVYRNGYVYHTKYDTADIIPMGTFQNAGDNILALTKAVANSPELAEAETIQGARLVFYDFLGWFMISYTMTVAYIVNIIVSLLALVAVILSLISFRNNLDLKWIHMTGEFAVVFMIQLVSIGLAIAILISLASIFDAVSRSMSWYSNMWMVFGLYYCPLMFALGVLPATYVSLRKKDVISLGCYVQMFLHSQCLVYIVVMLVMTAMGLRSAFVLLFTLIFYTLTTVINVVARLQLRDGIWILVHFIGQIIPFCFYVYYAIYSFDNFIPIQGRSGPTSNPEIFIILVTAATGLLITGQLIPTLCMFRRSILFMFGFLIVFFIFIILMVTPVGFPYKEVLSPQRFWIYHTERQFFGLNGTLKSEDSGYFLLPMDRHANSFVYDVMPQFTRQVSSAAECDSQMFCGSPLYMSRQIGQSYYSTWIPSSKPVFPVKTTLELVESIELEASQNLRLKFLLTGPDHVVLYITARNGSEIVDWSFSTSLPTVVSRFQSAPLYFIYIGQAKGNFPYEFFIDVQKLDPTVPSITITSVGHYIHHDEYQTEEFQDFLQGFPTWTHVTPWMCSYANYIY